MSDFRARLVQEIPYLRRYGRSLTFNAPDADDLVQACLERALSRQEQWDRNRKLRPWLFRILHNLHVSGIRRRVRERDHQRRYPQAAHTDSGQETATELNRVRQAMSRLPPEHRDVLFLVAVEGMTYRETAEVLSVAVGTVRSRVSRARESLRERLESGVGDRTLRGSVR